MKKISPAFVSAVAARCPTLEVVEAETRNIVAGSDASDPLGERGIGYVDGRPALVLPDDSVEFLEDSGATVFLCGRWWTTGQGVLFDGDDAVSVER